MAEEGVREWKGRIEKHYPDPNPFTGGYVTELSDPKGRYAKAWARTSEESRAIAYRRWDEKYR